MEEKIAVFELERKAKFRTVLLLALIGGPSAITGLVLAIVCFDYQSVLPAGIILFALGLIAVIFASLIGRSLSIRFRQEIVRILVENAYPDGDYSLAGGVDINILMTPRFFAYPDRHHEANLIRGTCMDLPFTMNDYRLERRVKNSRGNVSYQTYSKGRFLTFKFKRTFGEIVKVMEKAMFFNINFGPLTKMETESFAFNKKFMTLASDELTAFYILTPQIQERLLSYEKKFRGKIYYAFISNTCYIAIEDSVDSFAVSIAKPLSVANLVPIQSYIELPKRFIDDLGLDSSKFNSDLAYTAGK